MATLVPPFKVPGGKRRLAPLLLQHLPHLPTAYIEPFVGGGAVYLALREAGRLSPEVPVILADSCSATIAIWKAIQHDPKRLTDEMLAWQAAYIGNPKPEDMYYQERAEWNAGRQTASRALFLRATAFNGLWRINAAGGHNTPFGRYRTFRVPDFTTLSAAVQGVVFRCAPYADTIAAAPQGATMYCDPPYDGGFVSYTAAGFTTEDQTQLLEACKAHPGPVVYSNAATDLVLGMLRATWPEATIHYLTAKRTIAADAAARKAAREVVVVGPEHPNP